MGDHFVLLVDRLLTESTLGAAIASRDLSKQPEVLESDDFNIDCPSDDTISRDPSSPRKIVECRICQDEGEDAKMEIPCSCRGSLKYAHRRCVQKWCNEKGDTVCEICQQPFKPGYTAPPPLFQIGGIPMNFRGNWEVSRRDLNSHRFVAMVSTDRNFLNPNYDDDVYAPSTSRGLVSCRSVALIFMVLLILRHSLPIIVNGVQDYSLPMFLLLLLRVSGVVLPIYFIMRAVNAVQRRQRQQRSVDIRDIALDEEAGLQTLQNQPQVIHVHTALPV